MPVRSCRAMRAAALAKAARAAPVSMRAVTSWARDSPDRTSRRSVSRADETWKYIAMAARKPAAQPAVTVAMPDPPPAPPSTLAASDMVSAATMTNTIGTTARNSKLALLRT